MWRDIDLCIVNQAVHNLVEQMILVGFLNNPLETSIQMCFVDMPKLTVSMPFLVYF